MTNKIFGSVSLIHRLLPSIEVEELLDLSTQIENTPYGERLFGFYIGSQEVRVEFFRQIIKRYEDDRKENWAHPLETDEVEKELSGWARRHGSFCSINFTKETPIDVGDTEDFLSNIKRVLEKLLSIYYKHSKNVEYSWTTDKLIIASEIPILTILYHSELSNQTEIASFYIKVGNTMLITLRKR